MQLGHFACKSIFRLFEIPLILLILKTSECSRVVDEKSQKGINVSDYCPSIGECTEGTHVMCMYYDPKNVMGPLCHDPRNVTITKYMATQILDILNAIRSKVAFGKEKGKEGFLPRGYGMNRLRWDSELATFAQVLANQCTLRHDLCRATKRFPYPGQTAGLVRWTRPDWMALSKDAPFPKPGYNLAKLNYAVQHILKSWYTYKMHVTEKMIHNAPDWPTRPQNTSGMHYLTMISGSATHVGCGVSVYAEYSYHQIYLKINSVQLMCNFSDRPKKGKPVYNTEPPTEVGYTIRCGCPEGFEEDSDCLCSESPSKESEVQAPCDGPDCEPAVVLLPIFTVEDAPQHKLEQKSRRAESGSDSNCPHSSGLTGNTTSFFQDINDIFKPYAIKETDIEDDIFKYTTARSTTPSMHDAEPRNYNKALEKPRPHKSISQQGRIDNRIHQEAAVAKSKRRVIDRKGRYPPMDVKKRYFGKPPLGNKRIQSYRRIYDHVQRKTIPHALKPSIFSRVHKFELPGTGRRDDRKLFTVRVTDFKRDVAPRKDFSYSQKLLNNYLDKKRHHENFSMKTFRIINYYETSTLTAFLSTTLPTPKGRHNLITQRNSQGSLNRYMVSKFHYPEFNISNEPLRRRIDVKSFNEESDKKLMDLLDNLEQEVNHIDLNMNEKEIFDAKIRKIYGSVVGRNNDLPTIRNEHEIFRKNDSYLHLPIDILEDLNKKVHDNTIFETEDKVKELHLKLRPGMYSRPVVISQNSVENEEPKHCTSDTNSCRLRNDEHEEVNRPYFQQKSHKSGDENYVEQLLFKDGVRSENNLDIDDMKIPNLYKTESDNKKLKDDGFVEESRKNIYNRGQNMGNNRLNNRHIRYRNEVGRKNGYRNKGSISHGDVLGVNRRKQYQRKLDNLERKLHDVRSYRRRNEHERERAVRLMRPSSRDGVPIRPSVMKSPVGPIYMPERARFLHGF